MNIKVALSQALLCATLACSKHLIQLSKYSAFITTLLKLKGTMSPELLLYRIYYQRKYFGARSGPNILSKDILSNNE